MRDLGVTDPSIFGRAGLSEISWGPSTGPSRREARFVISSGGRIRGQGAQSKCRVLAVAAGCVVVLVAVVIAVTGKGAQSKCRVGFRV